MKTTKRIYSYLLRRNSNNNTNLALDTYMEVNLEDEIGVTEDDIAEFFNQWRLFDPGRTYAVQITRLS